MSKERPVLKNLIQENTTEIEKFQNGTLRPIIKMQHQILIALFKSYLVKRKVEFNKLTEAQKQVRLKTIFSKDMSFKNFNLGVIAGQFNVSEYQIYQINSSEYNKRILQIITQRIQDSISEL